MSTILEAHDVCKNYGSVEALKNFNLSVQEGTIFALLGPNGAGKTTFIKSILGLVHIQKGSIQLFGQPHTQREVRRSVGHLPEKFTFYPYYSVRGTLEFFCKLNGLAKALVPEAVLAAALDTHIEDLLDKKLRTLSKGQLQRVGLAAMLVGDKKLLILDEPFSGIDPIGIRDFKKLVVKLRDEKGKTIFLNSHILSEMEQVCDDFAILDKGICLAQGHLTEILGNTSLEEFFYHTVKV